MINWRRCHNVIVNAINKLRLPVPICTEMTQSSDVQVNINKIIIVKVKFILTFTIILGSYGFSYTQNRMKIGELIPDQTGNMLIVPLACMFEEETGQKEKNCAAMLNFKSMIIRYYFPYKHETGQSQVSRFSGISSSLMHRMMPF